MVAKNGKSISGAGEVHLYLIDVENQYKGLGEHLALLNPPEKKRAGSYRFEVDRRRFIVMRGLLRSVLARYLPSRPGEIEFGENEYGKPAVAGDIKFSLSSSVRMGLIGIARSEIGVDIEKIDPEKITPEMFRTIFTEREQKYLRRRNATPDPRILFRGWTRKESIVKAWGTGLYTPVNQVESHLDKKSFRSGYDGREWYTRDLDPGDPVYRAAVTVLSRGNEPVIQTHHI